MISLVQCSKLYFQSSSGARVQPRSAQQTSLHQRGGGGRAPAPKGLRQAQGLRRSAEDAARTKEESCSSGRSLFFLFLFFFIVFYFFLFVKMTSKFGIVEIRYCDVFRFISLGK